MLPVRLVTSPGEAIGNTWNESSRSKSMMLGMPALIVALLAGIAIAQVQYLSQASLEDTYNKRFQKASADLVQLSKELNRTQNVQSLSATGQKQAISDGDRAELARLQNAQKIYLDKLISLDPDNNEYRFELAKLVSPRDKAHAFSIIKELAPEEAPGYPLAHYVLAKHFFEEPARSQMELSGNLGIALKHIDHVLTRNDEDLELEAKLMKARILTRTQRYPEAYTLYEDLFEINPNYYRQMLDLNKQLGRTDRDQRLLDQAYISFEQLAAKPENQENDKRWIVVQTGIAKTLQQLKRFPEAEARLSQQIQKYAADVKGGPRRVFLERLMANTYIVWDGELASEKESYDGLDGELQQQLLSLYSKAYSNHSENVLVLQSLARLSLSTNPQIAEQARAIYDPNADFEAPSSVLNQLGNHALLNKRFAEAIQFYERARGKAPKDSAILNNLSYAYLVAEDDERNPERSLTLINQAIRNLPRGVSEEEVSKFLHTKGTALKQQERLHEALAVYEKALKARPMHADTLQSLIECYTGLNKQPPEQFIERLRQIESQGNFQPGQVTPGGTP